MAKFSKNTFKKIPFSKAQLLVLGALASAAGIYLVFFASAHVPGDSVVDVNLEIKDPQTGGFTKAATVRYGTPVELHWTSSSVLGKARLQCEAKAFSGSLRGWPPSTGNLQSHWWKGYQYTDGEASGYEHYYGTFYYTLECTDIVTNVSNADYAKAEVVAVPGGRPDCPNKPKPAEETCEEVIDQYF